MGLELMRQCIALKLDRHLAMRVTKLGEEERNRFKHILKELHTLGANSTDAVSVLNYEFPELFDSDDKEFQVDLQTLESFRNDNTQSQEDTHLHPALHENNPDNWCSSEVRALSACARSLISTEHLKIPPAFFGHPLRPHLGADFVRDLDTYKFEPKDLPVVHFIGVDRSHKRQSSATGEEERVRRVGSDNENDSTGQDRRTMTANKLEAAGLSLSNNKQIMLGLGFGDLRTDDKKQYKAYRDCRKAIWRCVERLKQPIILSKAFTNHSSSIITRSIEAGIALCQKME